MEGGCFGLVCCHVVSEEGAEKMKMKGFPWFEFPGGGFSCVRRILLKECVFPLTIHLSDLRPGWLDSGTLSRPWQRSRPVRDHFPGQDQWGEACRRHHGKLVCPSPSRPRTNIWPSYIYSSRFDLFHTVVQGKNWTPARYSNKEEEEADILKQNEIPNAANSFNFKTEI